MNDPRFHPGLQTWIANQGWHALRPIQEHATRVLFDTDRDAIIAAPTAAGKTEACFLPLLTLAARQPAATGFSILYLAPLKALINDQARRLQGMARACGLDASPWHGDVPRDDKARLRRAPHQGVLLMTPESLEGRFVYAAGDVRRFFADLKAVVIDELHAFPADNARGMHLRSLLRRLECNALAGRPVRRLGLSATLGDPTQAARTLRPENADNNPEVITDLETERPFTSRVKGHLQEPRQRAQDHCANALSQTFRGGRGLVFVRSRGEAEWYAERLSHGTGSVRFYAHHAGLTPETRHDLEERLKKRPAQTCLVCTSTLELGIDVGSIDLAAQVKAPWTVSALRQRLGRAGRRQDAPPARLHLHVLDDSPPATDRHAWRLPTEGLQTDAVQAAAMHRLLLDGWHEPPPPPLLHLSTLAQQLLSSLATGDNPTAPDLYKRLCGPFTAVPADLFKRLIRHLATSHGLIAAHRANGNQPLRLFLTPAGWEKVRERDFLAAFDTLIEYEAWSDGTGEHLGSLPAARLPEPDEDVLLSGRRWKLARIEPEHERIWLTPRTAPDDADPARMTTGASGAVHERIALEMKDLYENLDKHEWLDEPARKLLAHGRRTYERLNLVADPVCSQGAVTLLAPWTDSRHASALAMALGALGLDTTVYWPFLAVNSGHTAVRQTLRKLADMQGKGNTPINQLFACTAKLFVREKFHPLLSDRLIIEDAARGPLRLYDLPETAAGLLPTTSSTEE